MGLTCNGSEEEPKPQCVICFEVLSNKALKPSKLKRHHETKYKEHVMKSIEFFKNKEQELRKNMKFSLLIGKSGKPHTIAEDLILPAVKAMVSAMIGEEATNSFNKIALSNDTIKQQIDGLSRNIKEQLLRRINKSDYLSLRLDESTNITNKSSLRLSKKNYDPFPNIKNVIESTEEELSDKNSKYFIKHMSNMQRSFRDCFPVPDISRNWIRQPFEIDIHQINGLTSLEEDSLIEISTDTSLKIQFNQKSLEKFWLHVRKGLNTIIK
ncbi:Hypothetical protein CINCED_3A007729 [Cinara cedri]|uniref:Uncharacterized protein n=1 Tax=Cinara cedri TaxID=506608 RepID=A0A5E4MVP7_9HEMI|nr:Hypothetical protein CINCED_3A007729 [Cinara cedri]